MNYKRTAIIFSLFTVMLIMLCVRSGFIVGTMGSEYTRRTEAQRIAVRRYAPVRGDIYDKSGIPLTNRSKATVSLGSDGTVFDDEKGEISAPLRYGNTASHLLGYSDSDGVGVSGIERWCDDILRSDAYSEIVYSADGVGNPINDDTAYIRSKTASFGIGLTLDYHIQRIAEDIMDRYISRGAAVIIDISDFSIAAMVSRPDFNPSEIAAECNGDDGRLLNRALCAYDAGSVFKIVTLSAALEMNPMYASRLFYCTGSFLNNESNYFNCHRKEGHQTQTLSEAFANSCNCAFYETGMCTGAHEIISMANSFGMGSCLLSELAEEGSGNLPCKSDYTSHEVMNMSIGQGEIMVTPLQCAVMSAVIANGGVRRDVGVIRSRTDANGFDKHIFESGNEIEVMSESSARLVAQMMRECVLSGTAAEASNSPAEIAGKTGSAESGWVTDEGNTAVHGWFCGFFPYSSPRYAMAIFCEDGKSGAESCVTPFIKICEEILKIYPYKQ